MLEIILLVLVVLNLIISVFLGIFVVNLRERLGETFVDLFSLIQNTMIPPVKTWDEKMMEMEKIEMIRKKKNSGLKDV